MEGIKRTLGRVLGQEPTRTEVEDTYSDARLKQDRVEEKADQTQHIIKTLENQYAAKKRELFIWRYSSLRHMVTDTVNSYQKLDEAGAQQQSTGSKGGSRGLLADCEQFLSSMEQYKDQCEETRALSTKELQQQTKEAVQQTARLETQYKADCQRLDKLKTNQGTAEARWFGPRYGAYKRIIKEVIRDKPPVDGEPRV